MKKPLFLFVFCALGIGFFPGISVNQLVAQNQGTSLSLTSRYGLTPYEYIGGFGGGMQITYSFSPHFYLNAGIGAVGGDMEVLIADDSYAQRETFANLDLAFLWNLTPNQKRNRLGIGIGGSYNRAVFDYARAVNLPEIDMATHFADFSMLNLVLEETFFFSDHWGLTGRLTARSSLVEKAVLERNFINDTPRTIGGIRNSFTIDLGVSYRFRSE
jgi:hypothetical protein